ncbi:MAG: acetate--CoA ligase family protein [Anaerolineae bacterium]|nr:acetate--CoA ligase family protein [Anaerolineae bacterium]
MTAVELSVFFKPHGVAVIGASRDPQKLGHGVVRNLLEYRYTGPIYPVNPHADEILGLKTYPSIAAVPDPVDLAAIIVPAKHVEAALENCGKRGIRSVIVTSGGFRETGPDGAEREDALRRIAAQYQIRVIGPNCIGTIDAHTPLNTTFVIGMPRPGEIAFVSQSGAVAAAVIDWARGSGVGFSRIVSLGNQADVTESQMIEAIGQDGITRVIAAYMEGVSDGLEFLEAATRTARQTPVVILKAGRGRGGAQAIASHTGALAGDHAAYEAAFRRAGILQAHRMEELFDWARALAWQPLPQGRRVAVLTNAGGAAILAVDAIEEAGLDLAPLTEDTRAFLRQRVFAAASVNNPVDILAGSGPATYALCLDALLGDETVDAVVVIQTVQDWFAPISLAEVIGEVATSPLARHKPILAVIMGLASTNEATQVLHRKHIPNFAFPERVGSTLAAMWQRKQWLDALSVEPLPSKTLAYDQEMGKMTIEAGLEVLSQRNGQEAGWMSPEQVEMLLAAYHIRTPSMGLAPGIEHAVPLATSMGYPVVLKLAAEGVTHKTDIGGIALDITTPRQLQKTFKSLIKQASKHIAEKDIKGIYVQRMVRGETELIVGVVRDPQFGPLVMVGTGGTRVEMMRDVTFELAPLTREQAENMLDRTGAGRLLAGYRGSPPADRPAVVDTILRLAQIALDLPPIIEIEVNPLIVMRDGGGVQAVDARVKLDRNDAER